MKMEILNVAGLYRPFKIEENETAFSKTQNQLRNMTIFFSRGKLTSFWLILTLIIKKKRKQLPAQTDLQ